MTHTSRKQKVLASNVHATIHVPHLPEVLGSQYWPIRPTQEIFRRASETRIPQSGGPATLPSCIPPTWCQPLSHEANRDPRVPVIFDFLAGSQRITHSFRFADNAARPRRVKISPRRIFRDSDTSTVPPHRLDCHFRTAPRPNEARVAWG